MCCFASYLHVWQSYVRLWTHFEELARVGNLYSRNNFLRRVVLEVIIIFIVFYTNFKNIFKWFSILFFWHLEVKYYFYLCAMEFYCDQLRNTSSLIYSLLRNWCINCNRTLCSVMRYDTRNSRYRLEDSLLFN